MTEEGIDARARVLLDSLLRAAGPSSYERPAAEVWRESAREFAAVRGDALGNSFATVNAGGGPRIALVGHIDEIGLVVKHIDSSGVLFVGEIGAWDPAVLVGQRVTVSDVRRPRAGRHGQGCAPSPERGGAQARPAGARSLGRHRRARSRRCRRAVQIGDPIVMAAPAVELRGERLASRALDNRLGALVVLEAARRAAAAGDLHAEVIAVASVREETSYAGARTAAFSADPDVAITLDVTHSDDYPNSDQARVTGSRALGSGPSISRGAAQHEGVARRLIDVAREAGIPYTLEADGSASWTDSEAVQEVRRESRVVWWASRCATCTRPRRPATCATWSSRSNWLRASAAACNPERTGPNELFRRRAGARGRQALRARPRHLPWPHQRRARSRPRRPDPELDRVPREQGLLRRPLVPPRRAGFVLQGGCPNGTGTGGPGYEVVGTPPRFYEYKVGDFAMAKTAVAPPGASGSQFFVISGKSGEGLPAEYGILGHARDDDSLATIAASTRSAAETGLPASRCASTR